ncbi:hypothetical protein RhiJN_18310 [Ceratobasidium sp. AG-Ba]|nr:hypothetical protein RhiJN_18310 [Ceratobasidium sp. AG-Ba]
MSDAPDRQADDSIPVLTKDRIIQILATHGIYVPNPNNTTKYQILDIIKSTPAACQVALIEEAESKIVAQQLARTAYQKRKAESKMASRLDKRQKVQHGRSNTAESHFLVIPADEVVRACHRAFLAATSNNALKSEVCVCCARRLFAVTGSVMDLNAIPNPHHLRPSVQHFAHVLTKDMLLVTEYIITIEGKQHGWFCDSCTRALVQNRLPPLALANRMWIGPVPNQLSELTVPERALICIYHPKCYVYKLHPRNLWTYGGDDSHLQKGLAGNVTTYSLNIPDVVKMVSGKLLPRSLAILSATIVITVIGPGNIPPTWLLKTFQVRRDAVYAALLCLKYTTQHPGYLDIEISQAQLEQLPLAEVPLDILSTMRHDPDVGTAQRESESYLHNETFDKVYESAYPTSKQSATENTTDQNNTDSTPDVIPLQYLTAVDMDLSRISTEELMQYGVAKISPKQCAEGTYAVRHGTVPVNEFGYRPRKGTTEASKDTEPSGNLSVNAFPWQSGTSLETMSKIERNSY